MTDSLVIAAWKRIEAWYEAHGIADYLLPGASASEITELESELGQTLPDEFRESLKRHNGSVDSGWPHGDLLSARRIAENWQILTELLEGGDFSESIPDLEASDRVRLDWWNRHWVPLDDDFGGNGYVMDLAPAPAGSVGQVFFWDHECGPSEPEALSISNYLRLSLERLYEEEEEGKFSKMKYPRP
ncbi:SMI1/KNR4 family protein [Deinococcus lacus]|uniref:SMI1/KNR4 family protein n=1 Tax=Deinococcus lacus TaxID=392561 RepID=A0ABW1YE06_9DEIO